MDETDVHSEYPTSWKNSQLLYPWDIEEDWGDYYRDEYRVEIRDCCSPWNLGFSCKAETCAKIHCCNYKDCRSLFHTSHRAIQHSIVFFPRDIFFCARDNFRKNARDIEKTPVTILGQKKWPWHFFWCPWQKSQKYARDAKFWPWQISILR